MAEMMTVSEIITKALDDKEYRLQLASSFGKGNDFKYTDNSVSEELFLTFIERFKKDKELLRIYDNINYYILEEKNISDAVFQALVKVAKKRKNRWIFLGLTHADLKPEHMQYLKSLKFLNESDFY